MTAENTTIVDQVVKSYTQTNVLTKTAMITNSTHGSISALRYAEKTQKIFEKTDHCQGVTFSQEKIPEKFFGYYTRGGSPEPSH